MRIVSCHCTLHVANKKKKHLPDIHHSLSKAAASWITKKEANRGYHSRADWRGHPPFFCAQITLNLSDVSSPDAGRNDLWNDLRKKNWDKHLWAMTIC